MTTFFPDSDPVAEGRRRANALMSDRTPTFLLQDRHGELHELDGNDRVLVLAKSAQEAHRWIVDQGEQPYGRRYVLTRDLNRMIGLRVDCVVVLESFDFHPYRSAIEDQVRIVANKMVNFRRIDG